jgi:cell wall-associated NlpC family hydrolase
MNPAEAFAAFKRAQFDLRTTLCEVAFEGGALVGVADRQLEPLLYRYAAEHQVGLRVRYLSATRKWVSAPRVFLRGQPEAQAETVSELFYGEAIEVYDSHQGFCRVACARDRYLGYLPVTAISHQLLEPTHRLMALRAHLYAKPQVQSERLCELALNTPLAVERIQGEWAEVRLKDTRGYLKAALLRPLAQPLTPTPGSIAALAKAFLFTPYSWGGVSAWGLDCSGLVQTVYAAHGLALPRDADQQARIGDEVALAAARPGDLLFFPGHVAIALGGSRIVHANAHHMRVSIDDLSQPGYGATLREQLSSVRRVLAE